MANKNLKLRVDYCMRQCGDSEIEVARLTNRGADFIRAYLSGRYDGDVKAIEADLEGYLRKRGGFYSELESRKVVVTPTVQKIWRVADFCKEKKEIGLIVGHAGVGKTEALRAWIWKRDKSWKTVFITGDVTTKMGSFLAELCKKLNRTPGSKANSTFLEHAVWALSREPRLLIVDESHFLSWPILEAIRNIYDEADVGVVLSGQQELYNQLFRGSHWDQIRSRVGIFLEIEDIGADDIEPICDEIFPDLDGNCRDYLLELAQGPGKLRAAVKVLRRAVDMFVREGVPVNVILLKKLKESFVI